jgi:hypothetical protein
MMPYGMAERCVCPGRPRCGGFGTPHGLTPRHRESDATIHRGRITKQGNHLVRWAAVEAVQRLYGGPIGSTRARLAEKRGANIAKVAAARKLLTLVFYGLRDGHIRCLVPARTPAGAWFRRSQDARSRHD